jgi:uncharacterized protein YaiI (UPF0178 family)
MRTFDLIDCHVVKAMSIGRLVVTNQAGLASRLDLIIELGIACSDNGSLDDPSGRIGRPRDRD